MPGYVDTLYVTWRSPQTRTIHVVGRLRFDDVAKRYDFVYVGAVHRAIPEGFSPFPEFPELDRLYRSANLFPLFANRLMSKGRADRAAWLVALGLENDEPHPIQVLSRTGGTRLTDHLELIPVPEEINGAFVTYFLVRGIRHMESSDKIEERIDRLRPGEVLHCKHDAENPVDPLTCMIYTTQSERIGYVPAYLAPDIHKCEQHGGRIDIVVHQVNRPPAEAHHRLLCKVVAYWPEGMRPLDSIDYVPIHESLILAG